LTQVFLNFRTIDEPFGVALLNTKLSEEFGSEAVFLDSKSIPLGTVWEPEMFKAIENSAAVLVIMGRNWNATDELGRRRLDDPRDFVRREIIHAFEHGKQVIPVRFDVPRVPAEELPDELKRLPDLQDIEVRFRDSEIDIDRLAAKLRERIPALRPKETVSRTTGTTNVVHNNHGQVFQADKITFGDFHAGPVASP
jgi:TIR domain